MLSLKKYEDIEKSLYNEAHSLNNSFGGSFTCLKRYNIINLFNIFINLNIDKEISILEIGVAHGDTAKLLYDNFNNEKRKFYFFDTFDGLPPPTINDSVDATVAGILRFNLETVSKNIGLANNIFYIEGLIENTLENNLPNNIACAHIDCDLYSPTYYSLKKILPNMLKPSIIILDDYNCERWTGVKKACYEIEQEFNVKINLLCNNSTLGQGILVINDDIYKK